MTARPEREVRTPRAHGLAAACTRTLLDSRAGAGHAVDPVRAVLSVVAAHHADAPLRPEELAALTDLMRVRLREDLLAEGDAAGGGTRFGNGGAFSGKRERPPANGEPLMHDDGPWALLLRLVEADDHLTLCRLREACGFEPDPASAEVQAHLVGVAASPVLGEALATVPRYTFDWSAGTGAGEWTPQRLADHLAAVGARVGIGRYLEDRDVYTTDAYRGVGGERRTVHLGVDLFVPEGFPVHAPLAGVVHLAAENPVPRDYGPLVVLEHRTGGGRPFYTLYGHLSRHTLVEVRAGQSVEAGQAFATVGSAEENGGWVPHVHLQILTGLLGLGADVPGVAARSDLPLWRSVCPDPGPLLGLPEGTRAAPGRYGPGGAAP